MNLNLYKYYYKIVLFYYEIKNQINQIHNNIKLWTMFSIVIAFAVAGLIYFFSSLDRNGDNINYFLSAISQGLAAIFTLVFAITIFATQQIRKFTALDKLLNIWTKILMIIFAIGILLPLMQLGINEDILNLKIFNKSNLGLAVDLGIATFCIFAIIPFLISINRIIKYEGGLSSINIDIHNAIDSNQFAVAVYKLREYKELFFNASNDELELKTSIIEVIGEIGEIVIKKNPELLTRHVLKNLGDIGVKAVDKRLTVADYSIVEKAIIRLKENCIYAIKNNCDELDVFITHESLFKIGYKYLLKNTVKNTNSSLDEIVAYKFLFLNIKTIRIVTWQTPNYLVLKSLLEIIEAIIDKLFEEDKVRFSLISIKSDDDLKKLPEYKFGDVLELYLTVIWVLGAFIVKYSPEKARTSAFYIKHEQSKHNVLKNLLERKKYRKFAANFIHNQILLNYDIDFQDLEQSLADFEKIYESC